MEKTFVRRKPIKCPNCGFRPVAIYSYGEPAYSLETAEELEEGKIVFGGCCISEIALYGIARIVKQIFIRRN